MAAEKLVVINGQPYYENAQGRRRKVPTSELAAATGKPQIGTAGEGWNGVLPTGNPNRVGGPKSSVAFADNPVPRVSPRSFPGVPNLQGDRPAASEPAAPGGAAATAPYDYYAAADKYLTSMGMGPNVGGLADVGSTIASYNQARDAARKNAATANEQIGIYGQQGQASINEAGGQSEASALRNVAAVRDTNVQAQAAPDEGVKRAQDIATAQGIQLSPGILEDAARSKSIAQNVGAGIDAAAVGGVTSATQSKNNALQSSSNATQGARNITQGNLDRLLSQLDIEQADKVSSLNASNASAQAGYATQRAEMLLGLAGQIDPATGQPRVAGASDPMTAVLAELSAYDKKHEVGEHGKSAELGASQIVRIALSAPDPAAAEVGAIAGLEQVNAERAKKNMAPISRQWVLDKIRRGLALPAEAAQ